MSREIRGGNVLISEHLHRSVNDLWCWFDVVFGSRLWPRIHTVHWGGAWIFVRTYRNVSSRQVWHRVMNVVAHVYVRVKWGKTCARLYHAKVTATKTVIISTTNFFRNSIYLPLFSEKQNFDNKKYMPDNI